MEPDWLPPFNGHQGVLVDTTGFDPCQYFKLFMPDEAFELISAETNRYAHQFLSQNDDQISLFSRYNNWEDTSPSEIQAYMALQICMGLCRKNTIEDYWEQFWLTHTPFTDIMSRHRYESISAFLHFADNTAARPQRGEDGYNFLWKVQPLMTLCEDRYQMVYAPSGNLSIDESIIKFKGRTVIRQYLPNKPTRWGIKQFILCESATGYALKIITYCGKGTLEVLPGYTFTESVCLSLLDDYVGAGHTVFTDNFYTPPELYKALKRRLTGACGTVKINRKGMPASLKAAEMDKGDSPMFKVNSDMVACTWQDTKRVTLLSTVHGIDTVEKRLRSKGGQGGHRVVEKPKMAEDYNKSMGGVDLLDQKLGTFSYKHKSAKWYTTIYHRMRETALVNAYIIYAKETGQEAAGPRKFRQEVINGLLEGHVRRNRPVGRPSTTDRPARLTERHTIGRYEDPKYKPDCVVCSDRKSKKRHQTNYFCKQCKRPMCFIPCHEVYHFTVDYRAVGAKVVH